VVWTYRPGPVDGESVNVAVAEGGTIYWAARLGRPVDQLHLFVVGLDGVERARVPLGPKSDYQDSSSPILLANGRLLVVGCTDGSFYEYDPDGRVVTTYKLGMHQDTVAPGVGLDGTIYLNPREE
jgi:outer membrane protein assembly factor BamB